MRGTNILKAKFKAIKKCGTPHKPLEILGISGILWNGLGSKVNKKARKL
jgi:hypothetical protein